MVGREEKARGMVQVGNTPKGRENMAKLKMGSGIAGEKGEIDEREGQGQNGKGARWGEFMMDLIEWGFSGLLI